MSAQNFFEILSNKSQQDYFYFYGKLPESIKKDIQSYQDIFVENTDKEQFGGYIWLSSKGEKKF